MNNNGLGEKNAPSDEVHVGWGTVNIDPRVREEGTQARDHGWFRCESKKSRLSLVDGMVARMGYATQWVSQHLVPEYHGDGRQVRSVDGIGAKDRVEDHETQNSMAQHQGQLGGEREKLQSSHALHLEDFPMELPCVFASFLHRV